MQSPTFPDKGHDLTIKDVISILADWDVKHADQQPFFRPAYGVSNFDSTPPAIWIFNIGDTASKRSTDTSSPEGEAFIGTEETRLYLQIFGDASQANH